MGHVVARAGQRAVAPTTDWSGYAAFTVTSLIWGSTFLVIAFSDAVFAPLWGATLRLVVASVFLVAIALIRRPPLPRGGALRDVVLFGALQFGGNLAFLYLGEQKVPSGITAVVFATGPLQTAIYARLLGVERLDRVKLIAAITALTGVAIIFAGQLGVGVPLVSLAFVFGAAVSAAVATVLLHRAGRPSPWAINAIGAPIGAAICLVASFLLGEPHPLPSGLDQWWPVLYLAILGSLGAFVLYSWLVGRWSGTTASFVGVIVPVIALGLGAIFRSEHPPIVSFLGAAVVIAAVIVALTRSRPAAH